jgi:hypothetical protein
MPDLGNLSYSASLTLIHCPSLKPVTDPPDPSSSQCPSSVQNLGEDCDSEPTLWFPLLHKREVSSGDGIRVLRRSRGLLDRAKKASNGKGLEDQVRGWVQRKMESGVPEWRCSLPFLVGAPKMVNSFTYLFGC